MKSLTPFFLIFILAILTPSLQAQSTSSASKLWFNPDNTNEWVNSIAFGNEGEIIATAVTDKTVNTWDPVSGKMLQAYTGLRANATDVAFSPNDRYLAASSWDHTVRIWDLSGERRARSLATQKAAVSCLAWSPDGTMIAIGTWNNVVGLFDFESGRLIRRYQAHKSQVASIAFSHNGKYIAAGLRDSHLVIWDANSDQSVHVFEDHKHPVTDVAFSKDDRYLAAGDDGGNLLIWNLETGTLVKSFPGRYESGHSVHFDFGSQIYVGYQGNRKSFYHKPFWDVDQYAGVVNSLPGMAAKLESKSQFETEFEYFYRVSDAYTRLGPYVLMSELEEKQRTAARIAGSRKSIIIPPSELKFGEYDIAEGTFPLFIRGNKTILEIDRDNARTLFENKDVVRIEAVEQLTKDLSDIEVFNIRLLHPVTGYTYPLSEQIEIENIPATATLPASLVVTDVTFTDSNGDNRLSAGEHAVVQFTVANEGEGIAQIVRIVGETDADIEGLSASLGNIESKTSKHVSLSVTGGDALEGGNVEIKFSALEMNGFHADPFKIIIPTAAYEKPDLEIADVGISDAEGRAVITPGTVVDVTVRIMNSGRGHASAVKLRITPGEGVFLAETPSPKQGIFEAGSIGPGSFKDITFRAFANSEADDFPLRADLMERTGNHGATSDDLGLTLYRPQRSMQELVVSAKSIKNAADQAPSALTADIARDIPTAESENSDAVAVIIGNRSYRSGTPQVAFALNDALLTRRYVEQTLGYRPGNILYLEDATLTNMNVIFGDRNNASGRLADLVKKGRSDVFVFYSGHGAPDPNEQRGYLMPVDADPDRLSLTGYSLDVLYSNLAELEARSVTVVLDACFTGATGGGDMLIAQASPIGIRINDPSALLGDSAVVITASGGQQIASWYPEKRHGLLTYYFLKGLAGSADLTGDGSITAGEMNRWLNDINDGLPYTARRLHSREQTPQVWGNENMIIR